MALSADCVGDLAEEEELNIDDRFRIEASLEVTGVVGIKTLNDEDPDPERLVVLADFGGLSALLFTPRTFTSLK